MHSYVFLESLYTVALFPFEEYEAPPFELIMPFCVDMEEWFAKSQQNVAAVHCKSGKVTLPCISPVIII